MIKYDAEVNLKNFVLGCSIKLRYNRRLINVNIDRFEHSITKVLGVELSVAHYKLAQFASIVSSFVSYSATSNG